MIDLNIILQELDKEEDQKTPFLECYYPGGFKPPHEGHYEVVKDLASRSYVEKVVILIGHDTRDGITKEQSKKIWDLYLSLNPISKVVVKIADNSSPIKDIFSIMNEDLEKQIYVAAVNEPDNQKYLASLNKAFSTRIKPLIIEDKATTNGKRLSGTQVRELITKLKETILKLRSISDKNSTDYAKARNEYVNVNKEVEGCFPESIIQKGGYKNILNILGIPLLDISSLQEKDLFTIDWWKSRLDETLAEPEDTTDNVIADFIDFAAQALNLQKVPKIKFSDDQELAKNMHSLGAYNPTTDELLVVKGPRLTADILRTLAHELVHRKQNEMAPLKPEDGKTGSEIENEANAAAGVLLRQFGKYRPEIFTEADASKGDYKIYCDMDGVLVDFEKGYFELTKEKASYSTNPDQFWEPITKAGAAFWIKLQWMPDGKQLWEYIKQYNPELLSAPSREESSKIGKHVWVKRNLPGTKLILRSAERKQEFATPNSILIDDREDNIQRWKDAGGVGIHHTSAADTIQQLKNLGL